MKTSFLKVGNLQIAYLETNKEAEFTIFFIHGNSVAKNCWRKQYGSPLFNQYRLIAFDLPGCGESERSSQPLTDYTLTGLAGISAKVINTLSGKKPYLVAGLSLGTNILAELLPMIQPAGIVLAGPCIFGVLAGLDKIVMPGTQVAVVFMEEAMQEQVLRYAREGSASHLQEDIDIFVESYFTTDPALRTTLAADMASGSFSDEINNVLKKNISCLVVFGKDEKVVYPHYLDDLPLPLWNDTVYLLEGASHLVNIDQPEAFNQLLNRFAVHCFR